jgi:hypothetical protein
MIQRYQQYLRYHLILILRMYLKILKILNYLMFH